MDTILLISFGCKQEPNPKSEYAKSKLNCEKYIEEFCTKNNINFIILRSPIVLSINALAI